MTFPITFPGGGGGVSNPFTEAFVITPAVANVTPLTLNQSLTGSATNPAFVITPTWNTSGNATGVLFNVTNTASGTTSMLFDFQIGGVSRLKLDKNGNLTSDAAFPGYLNIYGSYLTVGRQTTPTSPLVSIGDTGGVGMGTGVGLNNIGVVAWGPNSIIGAPGDLFLRRDAANTLAQRNGVNAQAFRVANTDDGAGNFERAVISWQEAANVLHIGTMAGGTGSGRAVVLRGSPINFAVGGGATIIWQMNASGHLLANTDNTYDIGASGASRPRTIYAATSIISSGSVSVGATSAISWSGRGAFLSPADGIIRLSNAAATDFDRLQFGGTTSSFPALKRSTTFLETKLADDSAYAPHAMQYLDVTDGITAPAAATGRARIYVDTADGDLKVVFADGTVKTIVVDT